VNRTYGSVRGMRRSRSLRLTLLDCLLLNELLFTDEYSNIIIMKPIQTPDSAVAHFITFSCYQRRHLFRFPEHYNLFLNQLEKSRESNHFKVFAYVVMPNHAHLLIRFPESQTPSSTLRGLKRTTSYHLLNWYKRNNPEVYKYLSVKEGKRTVRRFWQAGVGYDHHVEGNERSLREIIEYIHNNPVRSGMVELPEEWRWSSAGYWIDNHDGLIKISSPWDEE